MTVASAQQLWRIGCRAMDPMKHPIMNRLNEGLFIELVLYDDLREQLLDVIGMGWERAADAISLMQIVAPRCEATPEQLATAIRRLEKDPTPAARQVLDLLRRHPASP